MKHTEKEMHITMKYSGDDYRRLLNHLQGTGWTPSRIYNDPKLGDGLKMYATSDMTGTMNGAKRVVLAMAGELKQAGFKVLRTKVEEILYDSAWYQ